MDEKEFNKRKIQPGLPTGGITAEEQAILDEAERIYLKQREKRDLEEAKRAGDPPKRRPKEMAFGGSVKEMAYGGSMKKMADGGYGAYGGEEKDMKAPTMYSKGLNLPAKPFAQGGPVGGKAVMAIVAKLRPKDKMGEDGEMEGMEEESSPSAHMEGMKVAVKELMSALKSGDEEAFASSLMNFIEMHKMKGEEYDD